MFVMFSVSSQDSKDAEQYFPLATNHSCWDWVRKREHKQEGEERLSIEREGKCKDRRT